MEISDWINLALKVDQWRTLREYVNETSGYIIRVKFRNLLRKFASQEGLGRRNSNTESHFIS